MCFEDIETQNVKFICNEGLVYLEANNLAEYADTLIHGFTTRIGGTSSGEYATLNFGFSTQDAHEDVMRNYKILSDRFGVNVNNIVFSKQVHDNNVRIV